jgi:dolichol-phosphate mannosyltransferase
MAGDAWVVIPTYNERDNLERLVETILALPQGFRVLVVDDGSPDGTGAIADRLAAASPRVEVLHRPRKEGIGPAYVAGFARALALGADFVLQMDADFSHDPADLPRLLAAAEDADLVIAWCSACRSPTRPAASSAGGGGCSPACSAGASPPAATASRSR